MRWIDVCKQWTAYTLILTVPMLFAIGHEGDAFASPYTNAAIQGTYALTDTGQTGALPDQYPLAQAGVGVVTFDGNGTFTGRSFQNVPLFGEQNLVATTLEGTYEVTSNGIGTSILNITIQIPGVPVEQQNLTLVITKSRFVRANRIADEVSLVQDQLGIPGTLTPLVASRLPPSCGDFKNDSFRGYYGFTLVGNGGFSPEAGHGLVIYDGVGHTSGTAIINLPNPAGPEDRKTVTTHFSGSYALDPDGIGTATNLGRGETKFVVTDAKCVGGHSVAMKAFFVVKNLDEATGSLLTGVMTKRSEFVKFTNQLE
jgi:hypothetical protein